MQMFSVRLAALRKECGLSQDDLAKIINKTRSAVSGYEIEDKEPSFELLCALAKYFNVSTDYLLGLSDERRHVEQVFYNDQRNFEEHFKRMPAEMRPIIAQCFDSFYLLLGRNACASTKSFSVYCNPCGQMYAIQWTPLVGLLPMPLPSLT